ncbi:MAG TPA: hypothetical protein VMV10_02900, partial [Pirellulales bacterium]|nr:hypothetical protein [Pirellulales bacterium]
FEFLRAAVQPFAVRAFVFLLGLHHDGKTLINRRKTTKISSKPVNAYAAQYGDDAVRAARKGGPRALRAIEQSGNYGSAAAELLARHGDEALWIVENPQRLKLLASYGDDAAEAMLKHKGLAEPLLAAFKKPAGKALAALDGQNARRLSMLAEGGELAKIGRADALLDVIGRYGNRGMDFVWRNKKTLAIGAALTAFLADPQPFIDGTSQLAENFAWPVAETVGGEIARRADWTWIGVAAIAAAAAYLALKFLVRERLRAARQRV